LKTRIENLLAQSITQLQHDGVLDSEISPSIVVTRSRDLSHGDFACNIAMALAKPAGMAPRALAEKIVAALPADKAVAKTEIAGPGFINFYLTSDTSLNIIREILQQGESFGRSEVGKGEKIQLEFVSANPTGPLHVGHGRGAAYGATVASLMRAVGFDVDCEYYVNDAGRQMNILAVSVWLRYLQENGIEISFPSNGYKSENYIYDIARALKQEHGDALVREAKTVMDGIPPDEPDGGDKDEHVDALIERARGLLASDYGTVFDAGLNAILDDIREDLEEFGVHYENWYSEQSLAERGLIDKAIKQLRAHGQLYEKQGALWFRSTDFGDEKDRVVVRDNGQVTYFASDIAYHLDKFERGYDRLINIWGADHHGYVKRVKSAIHALGKDDSKIDILLVQFAILYRGAERIQMSTRSGSFVTLRELREEVGKDAARFFYVMRKCEQHMDFDLDLAKSQSNDNPVYYIQYAHARVCSVMRQLAEKNLVHDVAAGNTNLELLTEVHENELITRLAAYPDTLEKAAVNAEPHALAHYLRDLANAFHSYYNAHAFIVDDSKLRDARLNLINATRQVLHNGLELLGVSAPESM
jgi:arginyl-tRNA synthetase